MNGFLRKVSADSSITYFPGRFPFAASCNLSWKTKSVKYFQQTFYEYHVSMTTSQCIHCIFFIISVFPFFNTFLFFSESKIINFHKCFGREVLLTNHMNVNDSNNVFIFILILLTLESKYSYISGTNPFTMDLDHLF